MIPLVAKGKVASKADKKSPHLNTTHCGQPQFRYTTIIIIPMNIGLLPIVRKKQTQIWTRTNKKTDIIRYIPRKTSPQGNLEHVAHQ